ncbi:MerR family transcriptional regulator [Glutamicibacter sp. M10]|uniref:transcriptional regulator FtsR n=1 Tax=Glutamicibacter sp. M10 TaxID=3023076 RepID=UPI00290569F2|nr:MerR family transcriptional regulator [Glutamicibacter sp. M10]
MSIFDAARSPRLEAQRHETVRQAALNIGEVLSELKDEFPRVTASKIRFLEDKGLIIPQRTSAGYRKYSSSDVSRLRFILSVQRDQYLPLKVIKDHLDAVDRGEAPEALPGEPQPHHSSSIATWLKPWSARPDWFLSLSYRA